MVDILLIISSEPEQCCAYPLVHGCEIAKSVYHFSKGTDCLNYVESLPLDTTIVALVDARVDDIAPLNVVNALHDAHGNMQVVAFLADNDERMINNAMLAGARCVVDTACTLEDLKTAITKVERSGRPVDTPDVETPELGEGAGVRIAVVSARGGSGKSYVATLLAATLAQSAKRTLLLDADIQFSDLALMFGRSEPMSAHDMQGFYAMKPEAFTKLSSPIAENLDLLRFEPSPELAETFAAKLSPLLKLCAHGYDATIINTGSFWTLFQSALLESCDCVIVVSDHRLPGIKATQGLNEILDRIQVPAARRLYLINAHSRPGLSLYDIEKALACENVFALPRMSEEFCLSVDAGDPCQALRESDEYANELMRIAESVATITGLPLHDAQAMHRRVAQGSWLKRLFS